MIPQDTLQAIPALLLSDRITYKGSEIQAVVKIVNDVNAELNEQAVAARVRPAPLQVVPKPAEEAAAKG